MRQCIIEVLKCYTSSNSRLMDENDCENAADDILAEMSLHGWYCLPVSEVEELTSALKPFADYGAIHAGQRVRTDQPLIELFGTKITGADVRAAHTAYANRSSRLTTPPQPASPDARWIEIGEYERRFADLDELEGQPFVIGYGRVQNGMRNVRLPIKFRSDPVFGWIVLDSGKPFSPSFVWPLPTPPEREA